MPSDKDGRLNLYSTATSPQRDGINSRAYQNKKRTRLIDSRVKKGIFASFTNCAIKLTNFQSVDSFAVEYTNLKSTNETDC